MLIVETIGRIRREHLIKGKSIKEIARGLKISRNTVRKVLRSGETSFSYEREIQPRPKLGRWKAELDRMLTANTSNPARERLTLIRLFEELRALGYEGGYDAVRRYARSWSREHASQMADAYVPLTFAPGEAYQFDWSHEIVVMNGVTTIVKVAHVRLCHSRMMFVRAYPRETQEMVFDAHERAFAFFKGACTRGIYDNMKTAVETIFVGKDRQYNRRLLQMCAHHLVEPMPRLIHIRNVPSTPFGRCSRRSGRSSLPIAAGSMDSTLCRLPCRRPAWFALMYKSGLDPTVNVRLRHSFNVGHDRRGGLDVVKDASFARAGAAGAVHP